MIKVTKEVITTCAENLLFKISDQERDETLEEFDAILTQMDFLSKIKNIDSSKSMTFPVSEIQYELRDDNPVEPVPAKVELEMVPSKLGNQVKIPKVIGGE